MFVNKKSMPNDTDVYWSWTHGILFDITENIRLHLQG